MPETQATPPRDPNRPRGCTCFRLRRTARQVTRIYDMHLLPVGLTLSQYSVLSNLMLSGPPSVNGMAEILGMDRTTLTRSLKPLITAKFLELETGDDKRSKRIAITALGRATWERAKPLWRAAQTEIETKLGPQQVKTLHDLLDESFATLNAVG